MMFTTCSHLYVLRSCLTAANRSTVLQSTWDLNLILPWLLLLFRAWSVFGKIGLCSIFELYLIILDHVRLHLHENARIHACVLNIWSWHSWGRYWSTCPHLCSSQSSSTAVNRLSALCDVYVGPTYDLRKTHLFRDCVLCDSCMIAFAWRCLKNTCMCRTFAIMPLQYVQWHGIFFWQLQSRGTSGWDSCYSSLPVGVHRNWLIASRRLLCNLSLLMT